MTEQKTTEKKTAAKKKKVLTASAVVVSIGLLIGACDAPDNNDSKTAAKPKVEQKKEKKTTKKVEINDFTKMLPAISKLADNKQMTKQEKYDKLMKLTSSYKPNKEDLETFRMITRFGAERIVKKDKNYSIAKEKEETILRALFIYRVLEKHYETKPYGLLGIDVLQVNRDLYLGREKLDSPWGRSNVAQIKKDLKAFE
ncbi:hypothetical protein [Fictibacillus sp. S7]|uniref:hypothetical protein n=1 Tax=Fictibacillus sp. S7 TaxID=2212476 RepID=UPI001013544C|nr:hypothetical protein [Fictibacillus sp. S7]RXY98552.1 hypothetical protein DMO16_02090 [Fictibacillus sp. S7]